MLWIWMSQFSVLNSISHSGKPWVASNRSSQRRFAPFLACDGCDHHFVWSYLKCIFSLWKWNNPVMQENGVGITWAGKFQELRM
jgi:hypothetical protein